MKEHISKLQDETNAFHEYTMKFINKDISMKDYKGYSGGFGSYAQRGGQSFMLRLRMNQGVVTKDKLKFVIDTCQKHNITRAHITTCQTIQLHDVSGLEVAAIMAEALEHNIVCRGGGGDFPRNVMCSPLSGVDTDEHFDVLPFAQAIGDYLLERINTYHLPRKLKIAFNSSDKNETHANFRDLGFCANADHTFDVYCAGGLGSNPMMGVKVGDHIQTSDCLNYVNAMIQLFMKHGNYENRAKARTRYMQETLGVDGLKEAFDDILHELHTKDAFDIQMDKHLFHKTGQGSINHPRVITQKQHGLYAVYYHPIGGMIAPAKLAEIYHVMQSMSDVQMRITPQQGIYLINCTADEAQSICQVTDDGAQNVFETSVACIGASTCQVGLRDSQGILRNAIMYLRAKNNAAQVLPRIFISGCLSSCGTNQIGRIGFQGTVKVIDKKPYSAFNLSLYGEESFTKARFGEILGCILEDDLCSFLAAIADAVIEHHITYDQWIVSYHDELNTIVANYIKK